MNGRIYDPNLGRFMSVDPFIQSPTNTQSINGYSYIMNNPIMGIDPTGYESEPVLGKDGDGNVYKQVDGEWVRIEGASNWNDLPNVSNGSGISSLGASGLSFNEQITKQNAATVKALNDSEAAKYLESEDDGARAEYHALKFDDGVLTSASIVCSYACRLDAGTKWYELMEGQRQLRDSIQSGQMEGFSLTGAVAATPFLATPLVAKGAAAASAYASASPMVKFLILELGMIGIELANQSALKKLDNHNIEQRNLKSNGLRVIYMLNKRGKIVALIKKAID
ncbi:RHS repeat domain-containing protein [Thalassotalea crassostreae]|uniref:RHS repeat domain-containing protein n=1 Tax=Thalassotalea crassostreae TaxID=1763536 RepID=UPI000839810E|nr:RHS repeat-associated core domain-containing protein [Thalassotalea crassostreae]